MNVSLFQAAAAMNASARWQEIISGNLASSSIPGFKRQELSFDAIHAGLMPTGRAGLPEHSLMPRASAFTSFTGGELRATGVNTDVAIEGSGFFAVELPDGRTAYTRDGEFRLNSTGQLVTKQGYPVLSDSGPVHMDPTQPGPLSIAANGEISQGEEVKGRLKIVDFDRPRLLTQISGGTFLATHPELIPTDATATSVRQGFLEGSNTSPATEMAGLITAMRSFEANQRLLQMHDDRMARMISELGNPS